MDPDEHLKALLGVHELDPRPALLYFHYDHEAEEAAKSSEGRASKRQCGTLDDEQVARWSFLYRCLEVDAGKSDAKLLERFGAPPKGPGFAIVNSNLEVVARSDSISDSKGVAQLLRTTLSSKLPEYWKSVEEQLATQKEALSEARRLERERKYDDALFQYEIVSRSQLRVGEFWDDAVEATRELEKRLEERK